MANTRFSYVKNFEEDPHLLFDCWTVIRVDGRSFKNFSDRHNFRKPNEPRALSLINAAACHVMSKFGDILLAYGHSDEYSFLLKKNSRMYNRRQQKILSSIVSLFSSAYCYYWKDFFPDQPMLSIPSFDGRTIVYPSYRSVVDYFSWRHADCHINNQYNTCFWSLVLNGKTHDEAYTWLKGTQKMEKNEYLFSTCGINYNSLPNSFKKGTTLVRVEDGVVLDFNDPDKMDENVQATIVSSSNPPISLMIDRHELDQLESKLCDITNDLGIKILHCDIIKQTFWDVVGHMIS
ncbi:hypothetical protein BEWA_032070 [Theileria equi strain WA]|uniref:tRNA(His) guanylyltransferase n=1 Tax=Theileria equi strain WA TaxID=1537102 RepID=L0AZN7_THEEQ|nr:hypothetical protein BEWA_032070 [Theileria equi strain WA]AFZ80354.1 hypothetical protein BEWA_032070 [Theileria equi strain WA]|eukprot:XP_004830020.1 hypothetical protein BEWA_032070 [Theileria equi strain WA]